MNIALTVGINKYKIPDSDLPGCVNDVNNVSKILTKYYQFSVMQIRAITDEQACKKIVWPIFTKMVERAKSNDHLFYHQSSHGSQIPDTKGNEPDHMTEILCYHDFDFKNPNTYATDDEFHDICSRLHPEATLDIMLDSCHSGDMLRDFGDNIAKFIPYPDFLPTTKSLQNILKGHDFPNVALWSGCRNDQSSADAYIAGQRQGALSWSFCKVSKQLIKKTEWRGTLHEIMTNHLKNKGFDQEPQLECSNTMIKKDIFK